MGNSISEEETIILDLLFSLFSPEAMVGMDMPEGTITTDTYYSDVYVPVTTKTFLETVNGL